jgi:membrane protein DedA with SNARE-associated domain
MLEFIENIFNHIQSPVTAYIVLFLSAYTENVIPPIPGDTVVLIGAYLVSIEKLDFWPVYISTTLGSVAGFITMYWLAVHFGYQFIHHKTSSKLFKEKYINKVKIWFSKWGYWVIFANRFLSGTRSVISLFAGLFHLNPLLVLILALASAAIWNGGLIFAGLLVGKNWQIIVTIITRYNQVIIILLFVIVIVLFIYKKRKKA